MDNPHLLIHVSSFPELVIIEKKGGRSLQEIRHPLEKLNTMGMNQASEAVGKDILGLMSYWYSNEFFPFREIRYERTFQDELDTINKLLARSIKHKTKIHLSTIQALVGDIILASPEMGKSMALEHLQSFKDQIANFPD